MPVNRDRPNEFRVEFLINQTIQIVTFFVKRGKDMYF
jgi:hypothetical protein